jgi:hypothetical protein
MNLDTMTYAALKHAGGFCNSGCPPGVYVFWVHGRVKVGRSSDAYTRFFFLLDTDQPFSRSARDVFLIGFMAALPGESLSALEAHLLKLCREFDGPPTLGREWFAGTSSCLNALTHLARQRITPNLDDNEPVVATRAGLPRATPVQRVKYFYPMFVSTRRRNLEYLVLACDNATNKLVVAKTCNPFRGNWTLLACYAQDPGCGVDMVELRETLKPPTRAEKVAAFFELNGWHSDLFFYTHTELQPMLLV